MSVGVDGGAEQRLEFGPQNAVDLGHRDLPAEIGERGDAIVRLGNPQGTMPEKCDRSGATLSAKPCSVTQRCTRMPIAAILSSGACALVRAPHPYADAVIAPLAAHPESCERADDPFFERRDEAAHIRARGA